MTKAELLSKVIAGGELTEPKATIAVDAVWEALENGLSKSDMVYFTRRDGSKVYAWKTKRRWWSFLLAPCAIFKRLAREAGDQNRETMQREMINENRDRIKGF